jgi:predicted HicB family RNase H-like nuclease
MNAMKYKGYAARIEYDADDRIFVGHLVGIRDIVGFHGAAVEELETAFHESVDNYLAACTKLGQHPNKPVSGKILLRVPPEIHSAAIMMAESEGKSLNQWAARVLAEAAHCS